MAASARSPDEFRHGEWGGLMMRWNSEELASVSPLIGELDSDRSPRSSELWQPGIVLRASEAQALNAGCCGPKALIIRQLYRIMQFDECRLFRHRLEHKLVQALVLHHYCGAAVPVTRGLRRELSGRDPAAARDYLATLASVPDGMLIKRTLGNGSGERKSFALPAAALEELVRTLPPTAPDSSLDILQERVAIAQEYRVHTLEDRVVPDLTFRRYGQGTSPAEQELAGAFVQELLDKLPAGLVRGAMYAWDVAQTGDKKFALIEANLAGFHPVFQAGFQCSGFFLGPWGAPLVVRLLRFIERRYHVKIEIQVDVAQETPEWEVYWWVARWYDLFRLADRIDEMAALSGQVGSLRKGGAEVRTPADHCAYTTLLGRLRSISETLVALA